MNELIQSIHEEKITKFRKFYNQSNKIKRLDIQKSEMDIYQNYRGRWSGK